MAAEVFGGTVHHDVRTQRQGVLVHGRRERVVHHQQGIVAVNEIGDGTEIEDFQRGVGGRFQKHHAGTLFQFGFKGAQFVAQQCARRDAKRRQLGFEQLQRAAVSVSQADDAAAAVREKHGSRSGHPGGEDERGLGALNGGKFRLHGLDAGIEPVAGVEAAGFAPLRHVQQRLGGGKRERRRGVHRRLRRTVGVVAQAGMDAQGGQAGGVAHGYALAAG